MGMAGQVIMEGGKIKNMKYISSINIRVSHEVVEDTVMTEQEITEIFGSEVALLVDGVTKLGQLSYSADKLEVQAENLRKMFFSH